MYFTLEKPCLGDWLILGCNDSCGGGLADFSYLRLTL